MIITPGSVEHLTLHWLMVSVFPRKLNGNSPAAQGPQRPLPMEVSLVIATPILCLILAGMMKTRMVGVTKLVRRIPMTGACTTCMATCRNGATTGSKIPTTSTLLILELQTILPVLCMANFALLVVGISSAPRKIAGVQPGEHSIPATLPMTLDSGWF